MNTRILVFLLLLGIVTSTLAQQLESGMPPSHDAKTSFKKFIIDLPPPDVQTLLEYDRKQGLPLRVGTCLDLQDNLVTEGQLESLAAGGFIIRMTYQTRDAIGSLLYYDTFDLPEGGRYYVYTPDFQTIHGAYTQASNPGGGAFATPFVPGNTVCIEYFHPGSPDIATLPRIHIGEFSYIYRPEGFTSTSRGYGGSQWCEVNINCPEGDDLKHEKRGIARILLKSGGATFWCTGSLVNNTAQNLEPLFLTADHCGQDASATELSQWIFYFNYEAPGCSNPPSEPGANMLTGCMHLASSGGSSGSITGSDFFLVKLNHGVPPNYNPYYNGWNMSGSISQRGVGIHHPAGDIKKISTYTQPTFSTQWGSTPGTHWGVYWSATVTNHGVTEPGSSGSPLFDPQKLVIGVLSGGDASCSNLTAPDLYGKFSFAWDQPGSTIDRRLKEWLDPMGTGTNSLPGTYGDVIYVIADFSADTTVIPVNSELSFTDRSFGDPVSWNWEFEGGNPKTSQAQHPTGIRYDHTGTFTVKLQASNEETSDESIKLAYIRVIPNIYPNPLWRSEHTSFYLDFGKRDISGLELYLYDAIGRQQRFLFGSAGREGLFTIQIPDLRAGMYFLRIHAGEDTEGYKLMLLNKQ